MSPSARIRRRRWGRLKSRASVGIAGTLPYPAKLVAQIALKNIAQGIHLANPEGTPGTKPKRASRRPFFDNGAGVSNWRLPMQRLLRDHACGRGARFSLHDGVPLQQVQNLPKKARSTCKRQPLRPDWNTGGLSGMQSTVNHVNTATTGMSPAGNALHHDAWTKNG